jgi:hypothetical protein
MVEPPQAATAAALLATITNHERATRPDLDDLNAGAARVLEASRLLERSWSGSAFGYHWDLYYGDFEKPPLGHNFSVEWGGIHGLPPKWQSRTPEEVKDRIEHASGISMERLRADDMKVVKSAENFREDLLIGLRGLVESRGRDEEAALFQEIARLKWGNEDEKKYMAQELKALPNMTRDSGAFAQGLRMPSHSCYASVAAGISAHCETLQKFWQLSLRLLKQVEVLPASKDLPPTPNAEAFTRSLPRPAEVTLAWLFHNVSWKFWSSMAGLLLTLFVAGIYVGQVGWVRQLAHLPSQPAAPLRETVDVQLEQMTRGHNERLLQFQKSIAEQESYAASTLFPYERDYHLKAAQKLREDMKLEEEAYNRSLLQLRSLFSGK